MSLLFNATKLRPQPSMIVPVASKAAFNGRAECTTLTTDVMSSGCSYATSD
eukprot:CAMPEP_0169158212 /NCGR_PEP_ID=MMETSP1015-20121227/55070_1 /TAXON_ID=342587 /ORGANISM="Karlodinium micrum, Strain CCMP2283" /LENGTH=50 /DNA_ID=CAMNT_0009229345 /DNA_START=98 /DNA_END=247 /DNA_ORIENTATION=-